MSIADLATFKQYLRELTSDLDATLQMALDAATAEANSFVGFDIEDEYGTSGAPPDVAMACMVLAQIHADSGDPDGNDHRRVAAQRLLCPHRRSTGLGSAA